MRQLLFAAVVALASQIFCAARATTALPKEKYGPAEALKFELRYKGSCCKQGALHCYPGAKGVPFADCANIIPMTASLWTPRELCADFQRRMSTVPKGRRKKGIIVVLKTERCATKVSRACTITTAALEKRSTPLVGEFLIYGVRIKPRDGDIPPGSLAIEKGADAWKNRAVREYHFLQGPGATLVFLNPQTGSKIATSNAAALELLEPIFLKDRGRTPKLNRLLHDVLSEIRKSKSHQG
jgi:hypothetical protein